MLQIVNFALREFSRHRIDKAKGADHKTRFQLDRRASIGAQSGTALHIGHEAEIRMLGQIGNDHDILTGNYSVADRQIARAFRKLHSRLFGNMEPVLVDDMDGRTRDVKDALPQSRQHFQFRHLGILDGHD
ncbi:hypothetical protein D3C87_1400530 [compost metagenome]